MTRSGASGYKTGCINSQPASAAESINHSATVATANLRIARRQASARSGGVHVWLARPSQGVCGVSVGSDGEPRVNRRRCDVWRGIEMTGVEGMRVEMRCVFMWIVLLLVVWRHVDAIDACKTATDRCKFVFGGASTGPVATFTLLRTANVPFTARLFSLVPRERLGVINSNGVAVEVVLPNGRGVSITRFASPRFARTHFKPMRIRGSGGYGLAHESFSGNQMLIAKRSCVRIYFTSYQVLRGNSSVNVHMSWRRARKLNRCVVFRML